jgi:hypothetical protein
MLITIQLAPYQTELILHKSNLTLMHCKAGADVAGQLGE